MTYTKRKKNGRMRAGQTHGWGAKKKHRGKGNKGGAGNAGSGKRGDAKKPSVWKDTYFGKKGFVRRKNMIALTTINVGDLDQKLPHFIYIGIAEDKQGTITLDLTKAKYEKLLGTGIVTKKYTITIAEASAQAIEKIKNKGGAVTVT